MTWKNDIMNVVKNNWGIGEIFALNDIYKFEQYFSNIHPENDHIKDKIRQVLQFLRDDGILEFVNNDGIYKRID